MNPRTLSLPLQALPKGCPEATTRRKTRFYYAVDTRGDIPLKDVFLNENIPANTGYYWLRKRRLIGSPATRRTDEAHVNPGPTLQGRILREEGTRLDPENLQPKPDFQGSTLHLSINISWHYKELYFYNDENDPPPVRIQKPPKLRRRPTTETEE
ncbi:hypothetical protein OEA41_009267 [Lepraria neglecta]|uniref:Uncharacterized protein n=1 Tax=Lepraria neglecta TaxID=209136 RepID=A0AAD9Z5J3_9LECA|nr:hypothetical protein OEA41_009267 [Lepraria neglecta]